MMTGGTPQETPKCSDDGKTLEAQKVSSNVAGAGKSRGELRVSIGTSPISIAMFDDTGGYNGKLDSDFLLGTC